MLNENRFLDTFRGYNVRPIITLCDYIIYGSQYISLEFFLSSKICPTSCYRLPDETKFPEIGGLYHSPSPKPPRSFGPDHLIKKLK